MNVRQNICPSCAAPVTVPPGADRMQCSFCMSSLRIERSGADIVLQQTERLAGSIEQTGARTQQVIQDSSSATQLELRRLQLSQKLANVQNRLGNVQSEIRSIERSPQNRVSRAQLHDLRQEEVVLKQQIGTLHAALYPSPVGDGRNPATSTSTAKMGSSTPLGWMFFSLRGRASRTVYWLGSFLVACLWVVVMATGGASADVDDTSTVAACIGFPAMIAMLWVFLAVTIKRYHDRNKSGWWVLVVLIPLVGPLWQFFELGFLPGTGGPNQYGQPGAPTG